MKEGLIGVQRKKKPNTRASQYSVAMGFGELVADKMAKQYRKAQAFSRQTM
ncbi:hypothetical protein [Selenomonas ruminantium]|uniref:hypothetical protein n=1 Tax=Selenomonas ruminantium TaxID=971 RepID=UPI001315915B|nr:hypothetical protein [Selenomonas ruminantium]